MLLPSDYIKELDYIGNGGMGTVQKGRLLNQQLIRQHGFQELAIKSFAGNENFGL